MEARKVVKLWPFSRLVEHQVESIVSMFAPRTLADGQELFKAGDPVDALYAKNKQTPQKLQHASTLCIH